MRAAAICNFIASLVLTTSGVLDVLYGSKTFGIVGLWIGGANFMMALTLSQAAHRHHTTKEGE